MDFLKLKETIHNNRNRDNVFRQLYTVSENDTFLLQSILYSSGIFLNDIKTKEDIYEKAEEQGIDKEVFNNPYFLHISFNSFDDSTIDIINSLDEDVFVELFVGQKVDTESLKKLSKITHKNCYIGSFAEIEINVSNQLTNLFPYSEEIDPTIIINSIDSNLEELINNANASYKNPKFLLNVKDKDTLEKLENSIHLFQDKDVTIKLDDDLFIENNPNNARDLIVRERKESNPFQKNNITFDYRDTSYDNLDQIYELERNIELILSHIPPNVSKLDITVYLSLFMINYFKYDNKRLKKDFDPETREQINFNELIKRGKGLCRDFAKFTKYLLNSAGVECEIINADGGENEDIPGHAFNVVNIDGKNSFLDNTWLAGTIQKGYIKSLEDSTDFLRSNEEFNHDDYKKELDQHKCETIDREAIKESVNRVMNWNHNYTIHPQAARDLIRKYLLNKMTIEEKIEESIPRRK